MIEVEEGGEYAGERYIWCRGCLRGRVVVDHPGQFSGTTLEELEAFIAEHREHAP